MHRPTAHLLNQSSSLQPTNLSYNNLLRCCCCWHTWGLGNTAEGCWLFQPVGAKESRLQDLLPFSSLHSGLLLEFHESGAAVLGQESWKVSVCFRKCRHLGPPCHLPAAQRESYYMQTEIRWPGKEGRQPSPAGPILLFLRSHSGETLVRQLSSCWGRKFFPLYPSAHLIGWYPAEPGVRKFPKAWTILLNWLHSIPGRAEQWKAGHRKGWEAVWSLTK